MRKESLRGGLTLVELIIVLAVLVIIGAMSYKDGHIYNSMVLSRAGRVEYMYSKSHLVPFGEYRPFGDIIPTPICRLS